MIVRTRPPWYVVMVTMTGSIVPAITPQIFAGALFGAMAASLHQVYRDSPTQKSLDFAFEPFTALGVAISIFLSFRNDACYQRWWEARKMWGMQLIAVRQLARTLTASGCTEETRGNILRLAAAHSHAMRGALRGDHDAVVAADQMLTAAELDVVLSNRNAPDAILLRAAQLVGAARADGSVDTYWAVAISSKLDELGHVQGACERLKNTPVPFVYSLLVQRTAYLYILLAPFAMASELGWWTIVFNALVAYTFFGLDAVATRLEAPFSTDPSSLALEALCRTIDIAVHEALGVPAPPMLKAVNHVLM